MNIKNSLLSLLIFLLGSSAVIGQEVLLNKKPQISGFISIEPMVSNFNGDIAFNQSTNIAAIFNQKFYFGGFSEAMLTSQQGGFFENIDCYEPNFGAAGLMFGSLIKAEKLVHFDLRAKIGIGGLRIDETDPPVVILDDFDSDYELVFVAQPSAGIEINISKYFKVNTHVGYRYVGGIDNDSYSSNALNGITGHIGLVFGWFGQKKVKDNNIDEMDDERIKL